MGIFVVISGIADLVFVYFSVGSNPGSSSNIMLTSVESIKRLLENF